MSMSIEQILENIKPVYDKYKVPLPGRITMSEHDLQCAVIQWARMNRVKHPALRLLFAIPNGGWRDIRTAARLKAEGVMPGVPDLCLPVARDPYIGLWIELKNGKDKKPTKAQLAVHEMLRDEGHEVVVAHDFAEAIRAIEEYLT